LSSYAGVFEELLMNFFVLFYIVLTIA